jgi:hypothetical protein
MKKFTEIIAEKAADKAAYTLRHTKPNFIARIVLHFAGDDYPELRELMEKKGFDRTLSGTTAKDKKVKSDLPGGIYYYNASISKNENKAHTLTTIYKEVKDGVEEIFSKDDNKTRQENTPPTIIMVETTCVKWEGLDEA